jgi:hypothetical protein
MAFSGKMRQLSGMDLASKLADVVFHCSEKHSEPYIVETMRHGTKMTEKPTTFGVNNSSSFPDEFEEGRLRAGIALKIWGFDAGATSFSQKHVSSGQTVTDSSRKSQRRTNKQKRFRSPMAQGPTPCSWNGG